MSKYQAIFISLSLRTRLRSKSHFNIAYFSPRREMNALSAHRDYTLRDALFRSIPELAFPRVLLGSLRIATVRRAASQYKVSPSFPYPPTLPPSTSFAPPALARPPSRAINERVIDARSVNRLLPFINSLGRRAAVAA